MLLTRATLLLRPIVLLFTVPFCLLPSWCSTAFPDSHFQGELLHEGWVKSPGPPTAILGKGYRYSIEKNGDGLVYLCLCLNIVEFKVLF